jgi:hypothetical protein
MDLAVGEPSAIASARVTVDRPTGFGPASGVQPMHLDLVAVDRDIARSGVWSLLELLDEDPVPFAMTCHRCGVLSLVPEGNDITTGRPFLDTFLTRHAQCAGR